MHPPTVIKQQHCGYQSIQQIGRRRTYRGDSVSACSAGSYYQNVRLLLNLGEPPLLLLNAVIHLKFERVSRLSQALHFLHFQSNVSINHVVRHNSSGFKKFAVTVQRIERLVKGV